MITISGVRLSSRVHGSPSKEQTLIASRQNFFGQAVAKARDESLEAYGGAGGCGSVRLMRRVDVLPQTCTAGRGTMS